MPHNQGAAELAAEPAAEPDAGSLFALQPRLRRRRTVLICGKSQVGKSHLCNILFMRPGSFAEGDCIASCTLKPAVETMVLVDPIEKVEYEVTFMDTPGMFDSRPMTANEVLMNHITDMIKYHRDLDSISRIIYVFRKGQVSPEEVQCLELLKSVLTVEAQNAGLCSMVVTHCDRMDGPQRQRIVDALKVSGLKDHMQMFTQAGRDGPDIIPVDFSPDSTTVSADRRAILRSILESTTEMHKTSVYKLFNALQEATDRKKLRDAFVAQLLTQLRQASGPEKSSICPTQ